MKTMILLFILPVFGAAQTIHVKDKEIVYEGKEKLGGPSASVTITLTRLLAGSMMDYQVEEEASDSIKLRAKMRLQTPYPIIRTVNYSIKVNSTDSGYKYKIDSVFFVEQLRGETADTVSSEKMLKNMDDTGDIVGLTEKTLNETDMRFQKLLAALRSEMKKKQSSR